MWHSKMMPKYAILKRKVEEKNGNHLATLVAKSPQTTKPFHSAPASRHAVPHRNMEYLMLVFAFNCDKLLHLHELAVSYKSLKCACIKVKFVNVTPLQKSSSVCIYLWYFYLPFLNRCMWCFFLCVSLKHLRITLFLACHQVTVEIS